jgi:hypothetical protein
MDCPADLAGSRVGCSGAIERATWQSPKLRVPDIWTDEIVVTEDQARQHDFLVTHRRLKKQGRTSLPAASSTRELRPGPT